jgi:hypothetical protein
MNALRTWNGNSNAPISDSVVLRQLSANNQPAQPIQNIEGCQKDDSPFPRGLYLYATIDVATV